MRHALSTQVQSKVAGALMTLAANSEDNKRKINSVGGVEVLCTILNKSNDRVVLKPVVGMGLLSIVYYNDRVVLKPVVGTGCNVGEWRSCVQYSTRAMTRSVLKLVVGTGLSVPLLALLPVHGVSAHRVSVSLCKRG